MAPKPGPISICVAMGRMPLSQLHNAYHDLPGLGFNLAKVPCRLALADVIRPERWFIIASNAFELPSPRTVRPCCNHLGGNFVYEMA